jgi:hypothetical protein
MNSKAATAKWKRGGELTTTATTAGMKSRSGRPAKRLPRKTIKTNRFGVSATEKAEVVMPTARAPQRQGTGASSTKLNARRGAELWSSSAPLNKAESPMATRQVLRRKTSASSTKRYAKRRDEFLSEARPPINAELPMATTQASQRLVGTSSTEGEPAQKAELLFATTPSVEANSGRRISIQIAPPRCEGE